MDSFVKTDNGYRFNRWFFFWYFAVLISAAAYIINVYGIEMTPYVKCEAPVCLNPVYDMKTLPCSGYCPPMKCEEDWCYQEQLTWGTYGTPEPPIKKYFWMFSIGLLIFVFAANHIFYNRNVRFSLPTKRKVMPDWLAAIVRKFSPEFKNEVDFSKVEFKKIRDMEE